MKKRLLTCLLAGALLLCCVQAYASGGAADTLISVSYLNNTFLPSLENTLQARANTATKTVYDAAVERLDGLGTSFMTALGATENLGNWTYSETAVSRTVKRDDVITVASGSTLLWTAGTATATVGLVDATAGVELAAGAALTANHRYLNAAEEATVTVNVLSDAALIALEGYWTITESSAEVSVFTDLVQAKDWFYSAVRYVVDQGMFNGVTTTRFAPSATMDRSMLATVLYRMEASPALSYAGAFPDVAEGQWYTAGVEWAAANGIVKGMGDGSFAPTASVTREQIASMLYRYAGEYLNLDVSQTGDMTAYTDHGKVSDWAEEGMLWAVGAGIISGADGGMLLPGNNASRAEVATMLQRFNNWSAGVV